MLTFIALTLLYFLPSIAAYNKRRFLTIFLFNFFLGWTVIGWIIALIWGLSTPGQTPHVIVVQQQGYCCQCGTRLFSTHCSACGR